MNIGIDIDGVILDSERHFNAYGELFDILIGGKGRTYPDKFKVQDKYKWSDPDFRRFMEEYIYDIERNAPLMPCVKEVLVELKKMGHRLIVISARGTNSEREVELAYERIAEEGMEFDEICLRAFDKPAVCREHNIDIMIDDASGNVDKISDGGITCLYFRDKHGLEVIKDNVIEVDSWSEILRYIKQIKVEK